tara:strand:+ start:284 stop:1030 length:747 start_codon:yes stop_codon:yes gene_type:complete
MRKLIAGLACRAKGSRLYAKPLQNLDMDKRLTVLDYIIETLGTIRSIDGIVLGIAEGNENLAFVDFAGERGIDYIVGSEKDVLQRLIQCSIKAQGTDLLRLTTESPYFYFDIIDSAWEDHKKSGNDLTMTNTLPEGSDIQIFTLDSLQRSHRFGDDKHRSELCGLYIREHLSEFNVQILPVPKKLSRSDLRLTVDYPEDLILCREVYNHFKKKAPGIPLLNIIKFVDENPTLHELVKQYVSDIDSIKR